MNLENWTLNLLVNYNTSETPSTGRQKLVIWNFHPRDPLARDIYVDTDRLDVPPRYWESITLVPMLATIMLAITVFLLVLFRQTPTLVISTVAATLTVIGVYLILNSLSDHRIRYE